MKNLPLQIHFFNNNKPLHFAWIGFMLAFLLPMISLAQSHVLSGKIIDAQTHQAIAFAAIGLVETGRGSVSDIDGNFILRIPNDYDGMIQVSHVSYKSKMLSTSQIEKKTTITLTKKTTELQNLIFESGENPANSIIKKVIKNRKNNDPAKLQSYSYNAYSKEIYRLEDVNQTMDSILMEIKSRDPASYSSRDSARISMDSVLERRYLFVSELVSEIKYISPSFQNKTVLATNISGFKNPLMSSVGTQFQTFGFYGHTIQLLDKEFVSPINPSALRQYNYYIEDTTFIESDTVFIISFAPKPKKKFESLSGTLSIHLKDYAITNVIATSSDPLSKVEIRIQQLYDKIYGQWFPIQLNTNILFKELDAEGYSLTLDNKMYLSDIDLEKELTAKDFSDASLIIRHENEAQQAKILDQKRVIPLDSMEMATYTSMDSLTSQLQIIENVLETMITMRLPMGKIDFRLSDVFGYNNYEKLRLGIGLETNQKFSKKLTFGGYGAYGFGDKAWKYGGHAKWLMHDRTNTYLRLSYKNDLREVGASSMFDEQINRVNDMVRSWNGSLFDQQTEYKTSFHTRLAPFLNIQVSWSQSAESPTYAYSYQQESAALTSYQVNEISFSARYVLNERYLDLYGHRMLLGYDYPAIGLKVSHGNSDWLGGDFDYYKYELRMEYKIRYRLGTSFFILRSAYIDGDLPYGRMITGWGNGTSSLSVPDYFQTMGLYEFLSDQAVAVFFNHNFGNILIDTRMMKPELVLYHNAGLGAISSPEVHQEVVFETMDQGYLEAGIGLNNLIRFNYLDVGYFGIGVDVLYRYGAYQLPDLSDNIAFKINMKFSF